MACCPDLGKQLLTQVLREHTLGLGTLVQFNTYTFTGMNKLSVRQPDYTDDGVQWTCLFDRCLTARQHR